jgi:hypothetical protein
MSNSATIEPVSKTNLITGETSHGIHIYDDFREAMLVIPFTELSLEPIDIVIKLTQLKHEPETYGQDSVDTIDFILYQIKKEGLSVRIGNKDYGYADLKDALDWDWRNVYACPKCGNTSWDDDCGDCPNCEEEIEMQFVEQEHYEL